MSTTSVETQGTVLQRGDGANPEVFTAVGQVTGVSGLGYSRGTIDVTTLDSTSREFKAAIKEGKDVSLDFIYDPANVEQEGLRLDADSAATRNFKIILPDAAATTFSFAALVTDWGTTAGGDDVWKLSVTFKPSGDVTKA